MLPSAGFRRRQLPQRSFGEHDLDSGAEIKSACREIIIQTRSGDDEPVVVREGGYPAGVRMVDLWLGSVLQLISPLAKRNGSDDFA